jgi:hypothetical protein
MNDLKKQFPGMNEPKIAIRLLERARERIKNYQNTFVCAAVEKVAQTFGEKMMAGILVGYISKLIGGPDATVIGWLAREHGLNIRDYKRDDSNHDYSDPSRQYRIDWIDSMIEQLR